MINIGLIGYGYWGPNLARNFNESEATNLKYICDFDEEKLKRAKGRYPAVEVTTDISAVLKDPDITGVAIATPVSTHHPIALEALRAGKHILVEKPLAETHAKALEILEEADKRNLQVMVDHTFPYTGAVRKMKELIQSGDLGEIYYYDSIRVNLGLFQRDVSVIWDLAVHDVSIVEFLLPQKPVAVSSTGIGHIKGHQPNISYITLYFQENTIAHINVNWLAPLKLRQTLLGGSKKMVVYDDLEPTEKIKVYDKGVSLATDPKEIYQRRIGYRIGDMWAPALEGREALSSMVGHFANCVETGEKPITSGESGARIVHVLEAASKSMEQKGVLIEL
jgi:predicted dehydrogenase